MSDKKWWPLVTRKRLNREVASTKTETRQHLVNHLRQNPRGLTLLDKVVIGKGVEIETPHFTVLGEHNLITHCLIRGPNSQFGEAPS